MIATARILTASRLQRGRSAVARAVRSAACALLVAACASYAEPVKNADTLQELGFLQPGITARDEIVARLGTPSQNYENGRIVSYDVYRTPEGRLTVTPAAGKGATGEIFRGHRYTLILVFASDGTLDRENLFDKHE